MATKQHSSRQRICLRGVGKGEGCSLGECADVRARPVRGEEAAFLQAKNLPEECGHDERALPWANVLWPAR